MASEGMTVFAVLFHSPAELMERPKIIGVFAERLEAALFCEAQIRYTEAKVRAKRAECPFNFLQYFRDDYTDEEKRGWFDIVEKRMLRRAG